MRHLFLVLTCTYLLAACGGQGGKAAEQKTDSVVKAPAANTDTTTAEQPEAASTKSDDYYSRPMQTNYPAAIRPYIPENYLVTDTCAGDLNKDAYPDLLAVLVKKDESILAKQSDTDVTRRLLVFTGTPDKGYKLATTTDKAIYCVTCGGMMGDPLMGLVIKNGYFSLEYYGGSRERWERTVTFKYSPTDTTWLLYKDGHSSFDAISEDPDGKDKKESKVYAVKEFGRITLDSFDVYKYYDWLK